VITDTKELNKEVAFLCASRDIEFQCGASGPINAEVVVIAEAPGEREVNTKAPLVGNSGKLLWDILRNYKLNRLSVYTTNVVKRRLISVEANVKKKKDAIGVQELHAYTEVLHEELRNLPNAKYFLLLGNYALRAMMGVNGITKYRGSVIHGEFQGRPVTYICANNPAAALHEPAQELVFKFDLHKFHRAISGKINQPDILYRTNPTYREIFDYLDAAQTHGRNGGLVAFDIEGMGGFTACVGIAISATDGMCINFRSQGTNRFTVEEETKIRLRLQQLFADKSIKFIAQNANFDMTWLWFKDRIQVHATYFDTMLAHHTLYPTLPHGLDFLTAQYTDYPYYKDEGGNWRDENDVDVFWEYNIKDCCYLHIIAEAQIKELRDQGLYDFFINHVMRLQPHLVKATVLGVKADVERKQQLIDTLTDDLAATKARVVDAARVCVGDPTFDLNPNSSQQLKRLFFERLKLVGRGTSTDRENRDRIVKHPRTSHEAKQLIEHLNEYLEKAKFFSTYVNSRLDVDGNFRCEYKQTGVQSAPGRLSSSQTMWGNGLNLQNIPEEAKDMFICDDGYTFVYFDKAQIEARIVAVLANIETWKEQFERARLEPGSYDAHCALAADMFKLPYDDVPKSDTDEHGNRTIRYVAKRCRHGLNYRMGPDTLATKAGLSLIEATKSYNIYHRTTPELRVWWADTIKEVKTTGMLFSPLGRRWIMLGRFDETMMDSIIAFKPQSTAGDHVSSIIYKSQEDPEWPSDAAAVILNIHDALVARVRLDSVARVIKVFNRYNLEPIRINGYDLIVPADYAIAEPDEHGVRRWSTLKKVKDLTPYLETV